MHFIGTISKYLNSLWIKATYNLSLILEKYQPTILEYIIKYNRVKLNAAIKYQELCASSPRFNAIHLAFKSAYLKCEKVVIKIHDRYAYKWRVPENGSWKNVCFYSANKDFSGNWRFYISDNEFGYMYWCHSAGGRDAHRPLVGEQTDFQDCHSHSTGDEAICHFTDGQDSHQISSGKSTSGGYTHIESFVIARDIRGYYHVGVKDGNVDFPIINYDIVPVVESRVKFIVIEYSTPNMKTPIEIKIDPKMLIVGNAILSPCFILRYLYMFPIYKGIELSINYKLTIIDHLATKIEIDSSQYIVLDRFNYKICKFT